MLTINLTSVFTVCGLNFAMRNFSCSRHAVADDFFELTPFYSSFSYRCQMFYFAVRVINSY